MNTGLAVPPAQAEAVASHHSHHQHHVSDQSDSSAPCSQCALKQSSEADRQALLTVQQPPVLPAAEADQIPIALNTGIVATILPDKPPGNFADRSVVMRL